MFDICITGDGGVGKSNMILKYVDNRFTESYITTIGIDFRDWYWKVNDIDYKLRLWDHAACSERFRTL